jgi:hypothetical protein
MLEKTKVHSPCLISAPLYGCTTASMTITGKVTFSNKKLKSAFKVGCTFFVAPIAYPMVIITRNIRGGISKNIFK